MIPKPLQDSHLPAETDSPERAGPDRTRRKRGRPCNDYPSTQTPTIGEIQQAALFYEGEGCYDIKLNRVIINQNIREKLDWLQVRFGGKVYGPYTAKPKGNDYYSWVLVRERALGFMFTIFTLLSKSRREQFKTGKREYQSTISDNGMSQAFIERKLNNSGAKRQRGKMGLFGMKR